MRSTITPTIEILGTAHQPKRRAPFFNEVLEVLKGGVQPSAFVFAGPGAWERAEDRRIRFGPGTALVLPQRVSPLDLYWPPLDSLLVAWPEHHPSTYQRKLDLACALIRDGVRFVAMEHVPQFIYATRGSRAGSQ